jgi:hypothetical protein
MKHPRVLAALVTSCLLACSSSSPDDAVEPLASSSEALVHTTDLAQTIPDHLAIMFTMSWFGIPKSGDPLGAGPDGGWGNYRIPGQCSGAGAPQSCVSGQRDIASRYRPLAGIYSSSGRDAESQNRIRLTLANARRPCAGDVGARIDAFAIQLDGTHFSSLHSQSPSQGEELPLQSLKHFLGEADAAGLANVVVPADDTTWYFNNGHWLGLDCKANRAQCVQYLQQDVVDMVTLSVRSPAAYKINGKPVVYFYVAGQLSPQEWAQIFASVRNTSIDGAKRDFYALASHQGGHGSPYFAAFDGISPWIDLAAWDATNGRTVRAHGAAYAASTHAELYANVPAGHVVLGGIAPGFDDFTNGWSQCSSRQLPRPGEAHPRDPGVLDGTIDFLKTKHAKGIVLQTWDDWTEGSFFEPSVSEGTAKLEQLQSRLGDLYGEAAVSPLALRSLWYGYGQPRACSAAHAPPNVALCAGTPTLPPASTCAAPAVQIPTQNESVGPAIDLRVTAPSCITAMIAYIDGVQAGPTIHATNIDQWIDVTMGTHRLNINGWDAQGNVFVSSSTTFTRTY